MAGEIINDDDLIFDCFYLSDMCSSCSKRCIPKRIEGPTRIYSSCGRTICDVVLIYKSNNIQLAAQMQMVTSTLKWIANSNSMSLYGQHNRIREMIQHNLGTTDAQTHPTDN